MRTRLAAAAVTALATPLLFGCGSSGEAEAPQEPETRTLTVQIEESAPFGDVYTQGTDGCVIYGGEDAEPAEITLRDQDGETIGSEEVPVNAYIDDEYGDTCTRDVDLEVPASATFIEVTVSNGVDEWTETVSDQDASVTVQT